jgi:transcriptional regulator with XRE-family HTH domain
VNVGFGSRLRQERKRLRLNQAEFAELGGVKRVSQHLYEQDVRLPDLGYVFRLAEQGVDVVYLVIGQRTGAAGSKDWIATATAAFRAIDDLAANRDPALSTAERERLFASLCRSLAADTSVPSGAHAIPARTWRRSSAP